MWKLHNTECQYYFIISDSVPPNVLQYSLESNGLDRNFSNPDVSLLIPSKPFHNVRHQYTFNNIFMSRPGEEIIWAKRTPLIQKLIYEFTFREYRLYSVCLLVQNMSYLNTFLNKFHS